MSDQRFNKRYGPRKPECKRGHPRTPENVNKVGNCIQCDRDRSRAKYWADPEASNAERKARRGTTWRNNHLLTNFGITESDYEALLEAQGGGCAVCGGQNVAGRRLAVDHDHATGRVRGLLCQHCNFAIGLVGDSPDRLVALAAYLMKTEEVSTNA